MSIAVAGLALFDAIAFGLALRYGPWGFVLLVVALGPALLVFDVIFVVFVLAVIWVAIRREPHPQLPIGNTSGRKAATMAQPTCNECGLPLMLSEAYDSVFCPQCDQWRESACLDPGCVACRERTSRPSEAADLRASNPWQ
jgi:predicted RNA-binding Zn-ribbon protein involved in translation (DUF1610 family)